MRIVFCGTPEYAVPSLERLAGLRPQHEVVGVVSQPDKPKGRSGTPAPPPVVEAARKLGFWGHDPIPGFSGNRIVSPEVPASCSLNPSTRRKSWRNSRRLPRTCCASWLTAGFLKKSALALPRLCAINAHGSLLPKYRGAAPIQAALLAGDKETGVTIMKMVRGLDKGPQMFQRAIPIQPGDDAATLHDKLAVLSADCFVEALGRSNPARLFSRRRTKRWLPTPPSSKRTPGAWTGERTRRS